MGDPSDLTRNKLSRRADFTLYIQHLKFTHIRDPVVVSLAWEWRLINFGLLL